MSQNQKGIAERERKYANNVCVCAQVCRNCICKCDTDSHWPKNSKCEVDGATTQPNFGFEKKKKRSQLFLLSKHYLLGGFSSELFIQRRNVYILICNTFRDVEWSIVINY